MHRLNYLLSAFACSIIVSVVVIALEQSSYALCAVIRLTISVATSTLDEAPMAYKPIESIIENIQDTVEIQKIINPIYNFKAH